MYIPSISVNNELCNRIKTLLGLNIKYQTDNDLSFLLQTRMIETFEVRNVSPILSMNNRYKNYATIGICKYLL